MGPRRRRSSTQRSPALPEEPAELTSAGEGQPHARLSLAAHRLWAWRADGFNDAARRESRRYRLGTRAPPEGRRSAPSLSRRRRWLGAISYGAWASTRDAPPTTRSTDLAAATSTSSS